MLSSQVHNSNITPGLAVVSYKTEVLTDLDFVAYFTHQFLRLDGVNAYVSNLSEGAITELNDIVKASNEAYSDTIDSANFIILLYNNLRNNLNAKLQNIVLSADKKVYAGETFEFEIRANSAQINAAQVESNPVDVTSPVSTPVEPTVAPVSTAEVTPVAEPTAPIDTTTVTPTSDVTNPIA